MARKEYGTDPYGIIARGVPGSDDGASVNFGRVGTPVRSLAAPGQTFGTGIGAGLKIPLNKDDTPDVKKKAKGGSVSASKRADGIARKGKTRGKMC